MSNFAFISNVSSQAAVPKSQLSCYHSPYCLVKAQHCLSKIMAVSASHQVSIASLMWSYDMWSQPFASKYDIYSFLYPSSGSEQKKSIFYVAICGLASVASQVHRNIQQVSPDGLRSISTTKWFYITIHPWPNSVHVWPNGRLKN